MTFGNQILRPWLPALGGVDGKATVSTPGPQRDHELRKRKGAHRPLARDVLYVGHASRQPRSVVNFCQTGARPCSSPWQGLQCPDMFFLSGHKYSKICMLVAVEVYVPNRVLNIYSFRT